MPRFCMVPLLTMSLWAQVEAPTARFEVVSIKPAERLTAEEMASPTYHRGLRVDPGRVDMRFMPLHELVSIAYNVDRWLISGPGWLTRPEPLESRIFDIQAKLPEGSMKSQMREMVRAMLTDRFKLAAHRETRNVPVLALVVSDKGATLTEAPAGTTPTPPPDGRKPAQDFDVGVDGEHIRGFVDGKVSTVIHSGPDGFTKVVNEEWFGGMSHFEDHGLTMDKLVRNLTVRCHVTVVNVTGLNGHYEATYDLPGLNTDAAEALSQAQAGIAKLGLKLEKRKADVEFLVIDHIEKDPTAN